MKLEHIKLEWLNKEVKNVISRSLDLDKYKLFYFGSRVKGQNREGSDIDIGIEGEQPLDLFLEAKIREELANLPTLCGVEFVDFKKVSADFKKVAESNIELIS